MADDVYGRLDRAHERYRDFPYLGGLSPEDRLDVIIETVDKADTADLGYLAMALVEPLLDSAGDAVADAFEATLETHKNLAIAYSYALIQSDELIARFESLVPLDEEPGVSE